MGRDLNRTGFIVTGAASGIGQATARQLHAAGARLALWDMDATALATVAAELDAHHEVVDVTDPDAVAASMAGSVTELGPLDGVVHCAGIMHAGAFDEVELSRHLRTVRVNVDGTVNIAHAALPQLRERGGSLVLMGSISAVFGPPEFAVYGASKAFVLNFAEALAIEAAEHGVHVASINPFFAATPMLDDNPDAGLVRNVGAVHTPEEIAAAILRAIRLRRRRSFPGWRPRAIWILSRYGAFAAPALMAMNWKHPLMARIWRRSVPGRNRPGAPHA